VSHITIEDGTVWPLPLGDTYHEAAWQARYGEPTKAQLLLLASVADAYQTLVTHPWGTRGSQKKIAMLRRAIKEKTRFRRELRRNLKDWARQSLPEGGDQ